MDKSPPPLLGFNNNVRHRGLVFHIQTEDSGTKHARIMTHLFADGGRIVQTARTDYSEHLGRDDMATIVRRLMKEQHKAMFVQLRAGELDERIETACGPLPVPATERLSLASAPILESAAPLPNPPRADVPQVAPEVAPESIEPPTRPRRLSNPSLRRMPPSIHPPPSGELELDVASLDAPTTRSDDDPRRAAALARPRSSERAAADDARYARSRPTAIFGEIPQPGASIFGERMSEKSLDEVILSYLADDLDGSTE